MIRPFKIGFAICAICVLVAAIELYSDKYDHLDVNAILADDTLREQYYNCFMDTGPCLTDDATFFKGNLPESIATKCMRCTERQKEMYGIIVEWYMAHQEEKWNTLIMKFLEDAKRMNIIPIEE